MKWNEMFKLIGPLSKSIKQIDNGYSMVLKNRTIFQFKEFSMEVTSIQLFKDKIILFNSETVKLVTKEQWSSMEFFVL